MSILDRSLTDYLAPGVTDKAAHNAAQRAAKIAKEEGLPDTAISTAQALAIGTVVGREFSGLGGTNR